MKVIHILMEVFQWLIFQQFMNTYDFDLDLKIKDSENYFTENLLIYMSGSIMRSILENESCTFCYVYLKEFKVFHVL